MAADRKGPLDDVRVLDLTRFLSGPYATMVLADLGADVLKVVRPDEAVALDGPLTVPAAFDWATNRDKRAVGLDLRSEAGRDSFLGLVAGADVVFDNFRPGTLDRLGLGYERLEQTNPRIITCDISGYGNAGPWAQMPSYDLIAQAASGSIDITGPHGDPSAPPVHWGVPIGDIAASLYAVIGILAALAARDRDGIGQRVGVSMLDCLLAISTYRAPQSFDAGLSARMDPHKGGAGTTPYGPYRCGDGRWIAIGFAQPPLGGSVHRDGRLRADLGSPLRHRARAESALRGARHRDGRDPPPSPGHGVGGHLHRGRGSRGKGQQPARGLRPPADRRSPDDPHDRGRLGPVGARGRGPDGDPAREPPAVVLESIADIGWDERGVHPAEAVETGGMPFAGTFVIEMDGNEPSKTLAMQILADLGADVLLIERPEPVRPRDADAAPDAFMLTDAFRWGMHRGKRGTIMNLKDPVERAAYYDLVAGADIVYDNYRPGVKSRLGVSREQLAAIRPALVTCSATGFGATGPWAHAPAYDVTLQAIAGSMSITGNGGEDDPPIRWGHPIGGLAGGLYGAIAVLAALRDVRRGRPSRHIDISLLDVQIALHSYRVPQTLDLGVEFRPEPRAGGSGARPYGVYATSDGRWFAAGITDQFWNGFCEAAAVPELTESPDFATGEARTRNADRLEEIVERAFRSRTSEEWEAAFLEHRLPGSRVLTLEEAFLHPQATLHGMLREVPTSRNRAVHVPGFPIQFSYSKTGHWTEPPGW